jgi:Uma2 family endonuclease
MTQIILDKQQRTYPDHTQLPETDGTFVKNDLEHPQSLLLTDSIEPVLQQLHPDAHYVIGQDTGIYWRETDPPESGAEAPDWFYVPEVPPLPNANFRRSYVLWKEPRAPLIALEFASRDGNEERDNTALDQVRGTKQKPGKFWIYEQKMRIPYYGIYVISTGELEVYYLDNGVYQPMEGNGRGHYPVAEMGVELGVWRGTYLYHPEQIWLRWWSLEGQLLLTGKERAIIAQAEVEKERVRAEQADLQVEQERARAEHERVRAEHERLEKEQERARAEEAGQRAEQEQLRAEQAEAIAQQEKQEAALAKQQYHQLLERLKAQGIDVGEL